MAEIKIGGWLEDKDALASFLAKKSTGTTLNSQMIAEQWDDAAKSKAFFSSRVTDGDILENFRRTIARVVSGEMSQNDARFWMRNFLETKGDASLIGMGFLPQEDAKDLGVSELASTSRLNLIIEQNVRMAQAARKWQEMKEEAQSFPYVQYHSRDDNKTRNSHRMLNGRIFRIDDPALLRVMPPQDFRCRCWLTRLADDELDGRPVDNGLPPGWRPPESGYSFDPEKWMNQGQEAREQWGDDLKQAFLEDTSKHAEAEVRFLEGRRKFWESHAGRDPDTASDAVRNIDGRIASIREQQTRPIAAKRAQTIEELDAALAKAEGEARKQKDVIAKKQDTSHVINETPPPSKENMKKIFSIKSSIFGDPDNIKLFKTEARKFVLQKFKGTSPINEISDLPVKLTSRGIKEATSGKRNKKELSALSILSDIIQNAEYSGVEALKKIKPGTKQMRVFKLDIMIDGIAVSITVKARETFNGEIIFHDLYETQQ